MTKYLVDIASQQINNQTIWQ